MAGPRAARPGRRSRDPRPADGAARARRARRASSSGRPTTRSTRSSIPGSRRASACSRSRSSGASWTCSSARATGASEAATAVSPGATAVRPGLHDSSLMVRSARSLCTIAVWLCDCGQESCVGLSLAAVTARTGPATAAQPRLTKQDADRFQGKLGRIQDFATAPKAQAQAKGSRASLADDAAHRRSSSTRTCTTT